MMNGTVNSSVSAHPHPCIAPPVAFIASRKAAARLPGCGVPQEGHAFADGLTRCPQSRHGFRLDGAAGRATAAVSGRGAPQAPQKRAPGSGV